VERTVPFALFTQSLVITWYHLAGHSPAVVRRRDTAPWYPAKAGRYFDTRASTFRQPPPGNPPAQGPDLATLGQSAGWLEDERANLHAAADYAATSGRSRHAIAIPAAISGFLAARGHWDQSAALHQDALAVARQADDRLGEADTLSTLGVLQRRRGLSVRRRNPGPGSGALPRYR